MSKKHSALLYSLLLWPGAGHVYLGWKKKGYCLIGLAVFLLLCLFFVFEIELIRQIRLLPDPQQAFKNVPELLNNIWHFQKVKLTGGLLSLLGVWIYAAVDIVLMEK